jgi:Family of unknown function (DUF6493)
VTDAWADVHELIDAADADALEKLFAGLDAGERAALVPALDEHRPAPAQPEPVVLPPLEPEPLPDLPQTGGFAIMWSGNEPAPQDRAGLLEYLQRQRMRQREQARGWEQRNLEQQARVDAQRLTERRYQTLALALLCCVRTADDGVRRLHRPWAAGPPLRPNPDVAVPVLLRLRGDAWCASLARGLVRRVRRTSTGTWLFTEALLRAVGADPPSRPAAIVQYVTTWRGGDLADQLARDPWFDHIVSFLFDEDVVAAALSTGVAGRDWPPALTTLIRTGRLPRATAIAGCLRRLRGGGRAGMLRPYMGLLTGAAPTVAELAGHRQELIGLLPTPFLPAASFAYQALRDIDAAERLDATAFDEVTRSVLSRPEKKLIRAHLGWVRDRLAADPTESDRLHDALVVGLHHPTADLAIETLDLIARHPPANTDQLRTELSMLDGPIAERLAALLGVAPEPQLPAAAPVMTPPPVMPAPLDLAALAGELVIVLGGDRDDPVRHELLLDGLVRAARGDRAETARVLKPLLANAWQPWRELIFAACGEVAPPLPPPAYHERNPLPLNVFISGRHTELVARLPADPPPALLATPATTAGHVDPTRVLVLLREAERDGWQPGHADLTQALLRLPRDIESGVRVEAERLVSPAGQAFASWLAGAPNEGEPATWIEEVRVGLDNSVRRVAMLAPGERLAMLADPRTPGQRVWNVWDRSLIGLWPAIAPSHREVIAAHVQPIAAADGAMSTRFLEGLALADGPAGPSMSSILANLLAATREPVRFAAVDALLTLGARPDWTSTGVGTEVAALVIGEQIVLQRVVKALAEASRAGAHHTIWEVAAAALPMLLPAGARPGLAELITLATAAARAGGRTASMPELDTVAAKPGRGQLVVAARELAAVLARP